MIIKEILNEYRTDYIATTVGQKVLDWAQQDHSAPKDEQSAEQLIDALAEADPSPNKKFLMWIATQYAKHNFRFEDINNIKNALTIFIKNINQIETKDINRYKTIADLYTVIKQFEKADPVQSKKQLSKAAKVSGTETIINTPNMKVVRLLSGEAATAYSAGTKWCTSDPVTFNRYASQGKIYVVIAKAGDDVRKFQLHMESNQLMDELDRSVSKKDVAFLSSYPEWAEFLNYLIKNHYKS